MKPDKDFPSTWIKFRKGLCVDCTAECCTIPVEVKEIDLENLDFGRGDETYKKWIKKLLKNGCIKSYRAATGLFTISARPNGECRFLDSETRLCTVYEKRPDVCRDFPEYVGPKIGYCPYKKKI